MKATAVIALWLFVSWGINFYKLTQCDFESPYKCEVIHAAGIIPPIALFTAWFDVDEVK